MSVRTSSRSTKKDGNGVNRRKAHSNEQFQLAMAEYNALRAEILKRSETRYQIISLNLIIAGTILTFGLRPDSPSNVLFVFPILGCFLTVLWSHHTFWIRRLSSYIKNHIEIIYDREGWESGIALRPSSNQMFSSSVFSGSGIFLGTEIIALGLGLLKSTFTKVDTVLIALDAIAILITIMAIVSLRQIKLKL